MLGVMTSFEDVFAALKDIYAPYAGPAIVLRDEPAKFFLGTHEVRAKDGYRTAFGGVDITQKYVSAHLMPVYVHPDLLADIVQPALFEKYANLVAAGFERFKQDGRFR